MHRLMDASCSNCNKFSHCCNNDLICISKYREKEQECEELKQWKKDAENLFRTQTDNADKIINRYKQALDEIEKQVETLLNRTPLFESGQIAEDIIKIQNIINKAKDSK